jgi:hypothetical protein
MRDFDCWSILIPAGVLLIIGVAVWAIWYEYRYPCKRYESYACTQTNCNKIGDVTICNSYESTCTRCVERYAERPE